MAKSRMPEPLRLRPLTCGFNSRSLPEAVPDAMFRYTQNMRQTDKGAGRFPGWTKFLSGFITNRVYNNEDGHDQLLSLQTYYEKLNDEDDSGVVEWPDATFCGVTLKTRSNGRQPYTFLAEVVSTVGTRSLLSGTQSRLYEHLIGKGNQRILRDGLGGISENPEIRLRHSQVGDFVLFTNNYDRPFKYTIGSPAHGCLMNATDEIPELADINLTKALVTFQYKNILFLCNTEEDGKRKGNMVRWCGADPMNWIEDPGFSLAGHYELDFGEEILAGGVIGDYAYLHTTRGVWQISLSADTSIVFNIFKLPGSDDSTARCIAYPFTFVSDGMAHYYMAKSAICKFDPSFPVPQVVDWIHGSSSVLYDNLNKSRCAAHTAGFMPSENEPVLFFSCAQGSDSLPSVTLYCNTRFGQCSKLDFGATAFVSCTPSNSPSYRDWLIENCICSEAELNSDELQEIGFRTIKEGSGQPKTTPPCTEFPTCIYTTEEITIDGITMEDFNQPSADPDAVCNFFPEATLADLCLNCQGETVFIFAHAEDWCIKQLGGAFSREMCTNTSGTGTYETVGYESRMLKILQFGTGQPKVMTRAAFEFDVAQELNPLEMNLRSGRSIRMQDPLDDARDKCQIEWLEEDPRTLECVDDDRSLQWPLYRRAEVLYLDFTWSGKGGDVNFSSLEIDVTQDPAHV